MAECVPVTVSIEKQTEDDFLELARLHAELQTLENDQDLDRELQQLGAFLVLNNQGNANNINRGEEACIQLYEDVESHLSGIRQGREALSAKLGGRDRTVWSCRILDSEGLPSLIYIH